MRTSYIVRTFPDEKSMDEFIDNKTMPLETITIINKSCYSSTKIKNEDNSWSNVPEVDIKTMAFLINSPVIYTYPNTKSYADYSQLKMWLHPRHQPDPKPASRPPAHD